MTKSQIDKLGERLKSGSYSDDDVRMLDELRQSFTVDYNQVVRTISECTGIEPTGRRIKSTQSIIAKLQRQSTKLSQIQDIAGCRITVEDMIQQNELVKKLLVAFPGASVTDRRDRPSHGYRAVHIIVSSNKRVEIQVRTLLQHLWAQLSEKLSDLIDPKIKYGDGPQNSRELLLNYAVIISHSEAIELRLDREPIDSLDLESTRQELQKLKERIITKIADEIRMLELKGKP